MKREFREFTAMEKLVAVKSVLESFGFDFGAMTVGEAFAMFRKIHATLEVASRDLEVLK